MGKIRPKDLENGAANLPANRYYGTNGNGEVGFHLVPGASESTGEATFKYGENISAGKLVFFGDGTFKERYKIGADVFSPYEAMAALDFGKTSSDMRYRIQFEVPSYGEYLSSVIIPIKKTGSGHTSSHTLQCKIVTIDGALVKASNTPTGANIANGQIVFNFDNIKLTVGESYWLEIVTGTTDSTNYFSLYSTSDNSSGATGNELSINGYWKYDGSVWNKTSTVRGITAQMRFSVKTEQGSVYECNSDMIDSSIPDGIASETKVAGESGKVMVVGVSTALSGLAAGARYKLNSDFLSGHRATTATDYSFGNATATTKRAQIFTNIINKPITKMLFYLQCVDRTISNKFVCKIVDVDETTGLPTDNLVDAGATASIDYADFNTGNKYQAIIVKFPSQFNLEINKRYAIVLEIDGTLNATGYMKVRGDSSGGDGNHYVLNGSSWNRVSSTSSLTYTFIYGDDVTDFMRHFRRYNGSTKQYVNLGSSYTQVAARFMVGAPTRVKSITFPFEPSGTPAYDLDVELQTNKILSHLDTDCGLRYAGSGGSEALSAYFGSTSAMKTAMGITPTIDKEVSRVGLYFWKQAATTYKVTVRIETDNNNKPSGTLVSEYATATEDQSLQTSTGSSNKYYCLFTFGGKFTLQRNTKYWIVCSLEGNAQVTSGYYGWYAKDGGSYSGGSIYRSADGTNWSALGSGNVRAYFGFDGTSNPSIDYPSGDLVSEGAKATLLHTDIGSGHHLTTINFNQEVSLIPNTIYWVVFKAPRPITETDYYRVSTCSNDQDWTMGTGRDMRMAYVMVSEERMSFGNVDSTGRYPRFFFTGERDDNGGALEIEAGDFAGKEVTAISPTAGVLSTGDAGNVFSKDLTSNASATLWSSIYVFRAPRDGQIKILKDKSWTVRSYTYGSAYAALSTQTGSTAATVNIEKGKLYQIENGTTDPQSFIISLQ